MECTDKTKLEIIFYKEKSSFFKSYYSVLLNHFFSNDEEFNKYIVGINEKNMLEVLNYYANYFRKRLLEVIDGKIWFDKLKSEM